MDPDKMHASLRKYIHFDSSTLSEVKQSLNSDTSLRLILTNISSLFNGNIYVLIVFVNYEFLATIKIKNIKHGAPITYILNAP